MHSFRGSNGTDFNHHGDYSGMVEIIGEYDSLKVPFEDVLELVAAYVRGEMVDRIEMASAREVLGLEDSQ